jgi:uncharacterized protein (DUF58 family)
LPETRNPSDYLRPEVLNRLSSLELKARLIVEGFVSGMHRSPYRGFSVEFAQHREYVPGDDIRHIDWKVFGKSDRFYIKEYEEETNLTATIALDTSESMLFADPDAEATRAGDRMTKYEYAACVAASLGYLITQQQDAVGLALYAAEVDRLIEPRARTAQLRDICAAIAQAEHPPRTDSALAIRALAERLRRRGLVIIVSDLFGSPASELLRSLALLRHRGHDVAVMCIWDPAERELPYERPSRFLHMEGAEDELIDPRAIREEYTRIVEEWLLEMKKGCMAARIDFVPVTTDQPLGVMLSAYLATRARLARV